MRAPFQVLIIPYKVINKEIFYGMFLRKKQMIWQFISGGGENNEIPVETAIRELREETTISVEKENVIQLDAKSTIPVVNITGDFTWGKDVFVVPEYTFAVDINGCEIKLSSEHKEVVWVKYEEAMDNLKFDSNKTALWEINEKLKRKLI